MNLDDFCKSVKRKFPDISAKADKEYARLWGDFTDTEYYSYSWFEALANVLNGEMRKETPPEDYSDIFGIISGSFESGGPEIKKAIDVAFVENLFWQVPEVNSESYWEVLPQNLKDLYVGFHHRTPL